MARSRRSLRAGLQCGGGRVLGGVGGRSGGGSGGGCRSGGGGRGGLRCSGDRGGGGGTGSSSYCIVVFIHRLLHGGVIGFPRGVFSLLQAVAALLLPSPPSPVLQRPHKTYQRQEGEDGGEKLVVQVIGAVDGDVLEEELQGELRPLGAPGFAAHGINVEELGEEEDQGREPQQPYLPPGQTARRCDEEGQEGPEADEPRFRAHLARQGDHEAQERQVAQAAGLQVNEEAQDRQAAEERRRRLRGHRVGPDEVLGDRRPDQRPHDRREKPPGHDMDDPEADEDPAQIEEIVHPEAVLLVHPADLKGHADEKRPAAGLLVVNLPVRVVLVVFEDAVVAHRRLPPQGHALGDVPVNIFIVVDAVNPGGHRGDGDGGSAQEGRQDQQAEVAPEPGRRAGGGNGGDDGGGVAAAPGNG